MFFQRFPHKNQNAVCFPDGNTASFFFQKQSTSGNTPAAARETHKIRRFPVCVPDLMIKSHWVHPHQVLLWHPESKSSLLAPRKKQSFHLSWYKKVVLRRMNPGIKSVCCAVHHKWQRQKYRRLFLQNRRQRLNMIIIRFLCQNSFLEKPDGLPSHFLTLSYCKFHHYIQYDKDSHPILLS